MSNLVKTSNKVNSNHLYKDCLFVGRWGWGGRRLSEAEYLQQLKARFWAKVDKTPGQGPQGKCWQWTASTYGSMGYGQIGVRRLAEDGSYKFSTPGAHVVAWYLSTGEWPDYNSDELICHTCDNPLCVRKLHLFKGTNKDNARDAMHKGRKPLYRETRPVVLRVRFTEDQCRAIKMAREEAGATLADIGQLLQMDFTAISHLESGRRPTLTFDKTQTLLSRLGLNFPLHTFTTFVGKKPHTSRSELFFQKK
jgi:hypothetical protein